MSTPKTTNLEKRLARCGKTQWILGGATAALVLGFVLLSYYPQNSRLGRLYGKIVSSRQELSANQTRVTTLPAVALEVDRLRVSLEHFDRRLPRQPELADFLRNVNQLSQQASLRKMNVAQEAPHRLELFSEQPILMQFDGDFTQVWSFLQQIETLPRLTRVRSLHLKSVDSKLGTVEVQLALNIYFTDG